MEGREQAGAGGAVLIAGPTASGKSRLALEIARARGGVVVNADSMQVYRELRVLTARPSPGDEAEAPHRLYGHVPAARRFSVGSWLAGIADVLAELRSAGRVAIVVGGTGLYFRALTQGLAPVPEIPPEVRAEVAAAAEGVASDALHARLADLAPGEAARLRPSDRGRILRALEVIAATGRPLADWQSATMAPPLVDPATVERIVLAPERAELHRRILERAGRMMHEGAPAEVEALAALGLDPDLPAMKAIGVRELIQHADGRLSLDEAVAAIATETRRYARRQETWFRNQMAEWPRLPA